MGWKQRVVFLNARWDSYSELMMIYLLGLGSTTHPCRKSAGMPGNVRGFEFDGLRFIGSNAPLFVHQFSHAWFDFRGKADAYANYFENS